MSLSVLFKRVLIAALIGVGGAATAPPADVAALPAFHLKLVKSEPAKNDTVESATRIRLWFSEAATVALTSIKLKGADGKEVAVGRVSFSGDVQQPVEAPITGVLAKGTYTIAYKTASKDMHPVAGEYSFVVR